MTHHGVELVERCDDVLDCFNRLALSLSESLDVSFFCRNEFVQRRIKESDRYGATFKCFVKSLEGSLLQMFELREGSFSFFNRI